MMEILSGIVLVACIAVALFVRHFLGSGDPNRFGYGSSADCDGDGGGDGGD